MKKYATTNENKHRLISLVVSKNEAETSINNQLTRGIEIKNSKINTEELLKSAKNEYNKWKKFTEELLKRIFDGPEMAVEFSVWYCGFINIDPTLGQEINNFREDVQEKLTRLESIKERLSLISKTDKNTQNEVKPIADSSNKNIFIVHGHDNTLKESVARFITKLNLNPIILHEQANSGNTLIEKFIKNSEVNYAIVLLTPDDKGSLKGKDEFKLRARQNVIFELGYFIGKIGREKVCALYDEEVELPSDFGSVVYVPIDKHNGWQLKVAKELKTIGLDIDLNSIL